MSSYQVGIKTDTGHKRANNQDSLTVPGIPAQVASRLIAERGFLVAVADGVGGFTAGDVASQTAVRALQDAYYRLPFTGDRETLRQAVTEANRAVWEAAQRRDLTGMASTLVAAVLRGPEVTLAHVGDSRAYRIGPGSMQQLTADHTLVGQLVASGALTQAEAAQHPQRHVITRTLGAAKEVQPELGAARLEPGDALLLCSDGLSNQVSAQQIAEAVRARPPQAAAEHLVASANAAGGSDNATVLIVRPANGARAGRAAAGGGIRAVEHRITGVLRRLTPVRSALILAGIVLLALVIALAARGGNQSQSGDQPKATTTAEAPAIEPAMGVTRVDILRTGTPAPTSTVGTDGSGRAQELLPICPSNCSPSYTVRKDQSVGQIAKLCGVSAEDICTLSQIANCDVITPGQILKIPCRQEQ